MTAKRKGWAVHLHHNKLFEYCYDYDERIRHIKEEKPKEEIKTRLRLFRMLTPAEMKLIPEPYQKAAKKYAEAVKKRYDEWKKYEEAEKKFREESGKNHREAEKKLNEAGKKYEEAWKKFYYAHHKYNKESDKYREDLEDAHTKICGCNEWNGQEIIFKRRIWSRAL